MPFIMDINMKDIREMEKREEKALKEWERSRIVKRCRECGQPYSYEKGQEDPKMCQNCRGETGDLIY